MESTQILAIRHGETDWNAETRIQGHIDIELNAHGRWQVEQVALALKDETIDCVYASDLSRAMATAHAIARQHGLTVNSLEALRERHLGHFQGKTWQDIESQHPHEAWQWKQRLPEWIPEGGGENLLMLADRIDTCLSAIAVRHIGQRIVCVTHGGVLDIMYRLATRQSLQSPRTWGLRNTAVNRLLWTPEGLQLVGWADERHLSDARDETGA
ncbi:MAG: histidine phosphatase family protein [Betaproteobacteria bacterium]|nr:histidine phosphatase family protein [Betaproteobacteria bacterium]